MSLFRSSQRPRSVAQTLVREVHVTVLQTAAYVGLLAAIILGAIEFVSSPVLERTAAHVMSLPELQLRSGWIEAAQAPKLRGRD